jgi:hypothetical protein
MGWENRGALSHFLGRSQKSGGFTFLCDLLFEKLHDQISPGKDSPDLAFGQKAPRFSSQ